VQILSICIPTIFTIRKSLRMLNNQTFLGNWHYLITSNWHFSVTRTWIIWLHLMFELQEDDIRVVKITDDTISLQGHSSERLKYEVCCSCFHLSREMAVGSDYL
jgi:hypothetical protein